MTANAEAAADWERLGQMLQSRRAEIHPKWARRSVFCRQRGLNYRLVFDVENAARTNFEPTTLRAFEVAYGLAEGSIDAALHGGQFTPVEIQPTPTLAIRELRVAPPDSSDLEGDLAAALTALGVSERGQEGLLELLRARDAAEDRRRRGA